MDNNTKSLELLFQRPLEPVFTPRDNGKTVFDLPDSYYTDRENDARPEIQFRFGDNIDRKIPLPELAKKPDLSFADKLPRNKPFSLFIDQHKAIATKLIQIFLDAPDLQSFVALCAYTKDRVNSVLFQYCFSVSVQHRPDTRHIVVPPVAEVFPANFVEPSVLIEARAEGSLFSKTGDRTHIDIPPNYTASDRENEQRMAYFREDIGVNMHHWHWHLVYPTQGPLEVVAKDRRGELFYYMHQQIIARYNVERFCHDLAKIKPLNNLREPLPEGYFPKILNSVNNRTYPARISGQSLQDLNRETSSLEIADMERWRDRIFAAIDQGFVMDTAGNHIPLDEERGIGILGDMLESSSLAVNPQFYGDLHNQGHNLIASAHDPDGRHLEEFGVMGDVTTAMRDPIFYRWHAFINNIFTKHKGLLPPYNEMQLQFEGVNVESVEVKVVSKNAKPNTLVTFWQKSDIDLAAALDFGPNGSIFATFTHLQHAPFVYTVNVSNMSDSKRRGTCRIFICPKVDERGTPLRLDDQRLLAIEMDKFTVDLQPGQNIIQRRSDESPVTIPFERSFRRVGQDFQPTAADELANFRFCGCGWPQHLLLPKGKVGGMLFDLFVMISDFTDDAVQQNNMGPDVCGDAASFCGLKDKLYPDRRTMGFPFDRRLPGNNLAALIGAYPNMHQNDIQIVFSNNVVHKI